MYLYFLLNMVNMHKPTIINRYNIPIEVKSPENT